MTTTKFLVQILKGEKKAYHYYDVDCVSVPHNKYTSKKIFVSLIKQHPDVAQYFPDDPLHQCDRQFAMDIINTVDPAFFGRVMKEYEEASLKQLATKTDKTITLDEDMFGVLTQYADMFQSRTARAGRARFNLPP